MAADRRVVLELIFTSFIKHWSIGHSTVVLLLIYSTCVRETVLGNLFYFYSTNIVSKNLLLPLALLLNFRRYSKRFLTPIIFLNGRQSVQPPYLFTMLVVEISTILKRDQLRGGLSLFRTTATLVTQLVYTKGSACKDDGT